MAFHLCFFQKGEGLRDEMMIGGICRTCYFEKSVVVNRSWRYLFQSVTVLLTLRVPVERRLTLNVPFLAYGAFSSLMVFRNKMGSKRITLVEDRDWPL